MSASAMAPEGGRVGGGDRRRLQRPAIVALVVAAALSALVPVLVLVVPTYTGVVVSSDGTERTVSSTLVDVNGPQVLLVALVPVAVTTLVALLLRNPIGRALSAVVVFLLLALGMISILSIGLAILPVAAALAVAVAWPQRQPASSAPTGLPASLTP